MTNPYQKKECAHQLFVELVEQMREAQKAYFRTRDREVLHQYKQLERLVDYHLEQQTTPGLF